MSLELFCFYIMCIVIRQTGKSIVTITTLNTACAFFCGEIVAFFCSKYEFAFFIVAHCIAFWYFICMISERAQCENRAQMHSNVTISLAYKKECVQLTKSSCITKNTTTHKLNETSN